MSKCSEPKSRPTSFLALGCVGAIATIAAVPSGALAQDAGGETTLQGVTVTDSALDDGYRTEAVTSPKATAAILDTPRTVSVIGGELLADTASYSIEEALRTVPGITLGAGEGGTASADIPLIRGVDATGDVFVDGARDVGSQSRETFAVESIEVVKGPDSAFGGRGTAAGAINLVSKLAREGTFATAELTAGTSDLVRVTGDVNAELTEGLAVRVVGLFHDSEVAGRDSVHDDRWGIAPSITWGAGTPISATLAYYHFETDAMPDYGIPLTTAGQLPGGVRVPADVDRDNFYGLEARDFQETSVDAASFLFNGYLGGGLTLSNVTRFSRARNNYIVTNPDDSKGNVINGTVWRGVKSRNSLNESITSNTNLSAVFDTGGVGHSLSTGFEFAVSDSFNRGYDVASGVNNCALEPATSFNCTDLYNPDPSDPWVGSITPSSTPGEASAEEYSFYLFDTITLTPSLLLNGGVRWTDFSAKGSGTSRGVPFSGSESGDFVTWQGGVIFKPSAQSSVYFSYANSKTPPGATVGEGAANISAAILSPQSFENWELGAKAELLGGNLLLAGALYRVDRGNVIETDLLGDAIGVYDSARLQGVELSASGQVGPLSVMLGYTFVDSELRAVAAGSEANLGNALPNTPRHNYAATVNWQLTEQFSVGGGAYGASKRYADAANLNSADGYVRFDANAQLALNERFDVRLNVQNLADKRYITKLRNPHFAVPAAGRQGLVTVTMRY